jgi:hypothetical protein
LDRRAAKHVAHVREFRQALPERHFQASLRKTGLTPRCVAITVGVVW